MGRTYVDNAFLLNWIWNPFHPLLVALDYVKVAFWISLHLAPIILW